MLYFNGRCEISYLIESTYIRNTISSCTYPISWVQGTTFSSSIYLQLSSRYSFPTHIIFHTIHPSFLWSSAPFIAFIYPFPNNGYHSSVSRVHTTTRAFAVSTWIGRFYRSTVHVSWYTHDWRTFKTSYWKYLLTPCSYTTTSVPTHTHQY